MNLQEATFFDIMDNYLFWSEKKSLIIKISNKINNYWLFWEISEKCNRIYFSKFFAKFIFVVKSFCTLAFRDFKDPENL